MIRKRYEYLQQNHKPEFDRKTKYIYFKEGDQVLLWDDNVPKGIARKLHPRWLGPFVVLRRSSAYVYEILYKGKKKMVHARRLIEYHQYLLPDWELPKQKQQESDTTRIASDFAKDTELKDEVGKEDQQHAEKKSTGTPSRVEKEKKITEIFTEHIKDGSKHTIMDFNPHITSTEGTTDARKIETELFYLVKQQKELLLAKVVSVQPITVPMYQYGWTKTTTVKIGRN